MQSEKSGVKITTKLLTVNKYSVKSYSKSSFLLKLP